jgi:hypothetical protein
MNNYTKNLIRTAVPAIVGAVVSYITKKTAHVSPSVLAVVFPAVTTGYYAVVRALEVKYPKLSWLLGALPVKTAGSTPTDLTKN